MRPLIGITTSEVRPLTYAHQAPVDEPFRAEMGLGIVYTNALELGRRGAGRPAAARRADDRRPARPPRRDRALRRSGRRSGRVRSGARPEVGPDLAAPRPLRARAGAGCRRARDADPRDLPGLPGPQRRPRRRPDPAHRLGRHQQRAPSPPALSAASGWTHPIEIEPDSRLARADRHHRARRQQLPPPGGADARPRFAGDRAGARRRDRGDRGPGASVPGRRPVARRVRYRARRPGSRCFEAWSRPR